MCPRNLTPSHTLLRLRPCTWLAAMELPLDLAHEVRLPTTTDDSPSAKRAVECETSVSTSQLTGPSSCGVSYPHSTMQGSGEPCMDCELLCDGMPSDTKCSHNPPAMLVSRVDPPQLHLCCCHRQESLPTVYLPACRQPTK